MKTCTCLILLVVLFFSTASGQQPLSQKAIVLKRTIEMNHLSPRPVDDSFSIAVFNTVIRSLDSRSLFFTEADYKLLQSFHTKLDEELTGKTTGFYEALLPVYKRALQRADSILLKHLSKPFDFTVNETISMGKNGSFNFAADVAALGNRWSRYLKFLVLNQLNEIAEDSSGKTTIKTLLKSEEAGLREQIKNAESKTIKRILNHPAGLPEYVKEIYLNAIASCFDPHSNYFSPIGKEKFKEALSTEELSFGVDLDETENGEVVIDKITPGGPAWKSGDISKGDKIISMQWEGKEPVDMTGQSAADAYELIDESNKDRIVVKVKKADGTTRTVLMRKEKIENEDNIVKGFILQGSKKIGYIVLPSFYTEWENETGSSCANDVAKEIVKLKREGIEGLLLDVRYNGGGSLQEAMEMIGIFVDEGPLMGVQEPKSKVKFLKDPNRGTIYNGPLGLMINGQSASASEILAASLQDYNRAVIIGSSSYGKATMQQMFGIDTMTTTPSTGASGKDMVKITVGKLYRLNGTSAQLNGVKPDISLPDAFDALEYSERFAAFALESGTTDKNAYYKPLAALPIGQLAGKSAERVAADDVFKGIKELQQSIKARKEKTIPLTVDGYTQWAKQNQLNMDAYLRPRSSHSLFTVTNPAADKTLLQGDEFAAEINEGWKKSILNDIYIREAFLVLTDLVNLQK